MTALRRLAAPSVLAYSRPRKVSGDCRGAGRPYGKFDHAPVVDNGKDAPSKVMQNFLVKSFPAATPRAGGALPDRAIANLLQTLFTISHQGGINLLRFRPSSFPALATPALHCVRLVEKPKRSRYKSPAFEMEETSTLHPWQANSRARRENPV